MKTHRKLLLFLAVLLLLGASFVSQQPSARNTIALLARQQTQMEDFVQAVKSEAARPHELTSPPELTQYASPEDTRFTDIFTRDGQLYGTPTNIVLYHDQLLPRDLQDTWAALSGGRPGFTSFTCTAAENGAVTAAFHYEGSWRKYDGGHYRTCHALIWLDNAFPEPPNSALLPLTEQEGLAISQQGRWFYASETHYDG